MLQWVVKGLLILLMFGVIFGFVWTWFVERSNYATEFASGKVPTPLPDGLYLGSVPGHTFSWKGKKFDAKSASGINIFDNGDGVTVEKYPFGTYVTKGVRNEGREVLAIDYAVSGSPFYFWPILDEIVETAPGHFIGKLHIRFIPWLPFTLAFFMLEKAPL